LDDGILQIYDLYNIHCTYFVIFWKTQIQPTRSLEVSEQVKTGHHDDGNVKQTGGSQSEGASLVVVKRGRGRPRKVYRLTIQYFYVISTDTVVFKMYTTFAQILWNLGKPSKIRPTVSSRQNILAV